MAVRLFEDKEHANSYWKYRISPSEELIGKVLQFHRSNKNSANDLAVDVGCGSGQGTLLLAPHFTHVVGTDISPAQLGMGRKNVNIPNISYRESPAEELPFEDGSVDLVTAMSAFHWFDHSRFLQEAHRVLKPHGCLAVLNYTMDMELSYRDCSENLNHICNEFYAALRPFRNPYLGSSSFELYKKTYDSLQYPVKEWQDIFWVKKTVALSGYVGMVESFSAFQALLKKDPEEARRLSQDIEQRLLRAMGATSSETEVIMGVKYFYFLACKPEND
ncbi:putative methyltransferase DDB_G0268948 [Labeo rohita]|uniref:putative methyltransferase DDB_G0268948 n=1 Tax=Labeo rohita TaxID=84645 RepID=UPI0021E2AB2C|nr:putative methyltransferase DDB_G0268948 [Labeo rohita]